MADDEMSRTMAAYLYDLGYLLKEEAVEAKRRKQSAQNEGDRLFEMGRAMGYLEVISLMQQQATAFGLPLESLRLDGIDPERDLL